jgi:hypothetical protein
MAAKLFSVDVDMVVDESYVLNTFRSNESEGLPRFSENDLPSSWDNGQMFFLTPQVSKSISRSDSFKDMLNLSSVSRENSTSFLDSVDKLVLGTDPADDFAASRENSGFLSSLTRETSADLNKLLCGITSDISDLVPSTSGQNGSHAHDKADTPKNDVAQQQNNRVDNTHNVQHNAAADLKRMELSNLVHGLESQPPLSARPAAAPNLPPPPPLAPCGRGAPGGSRRGAHVKERPEMQRAARKGAEHWAARVCELRARWAERAAARPAFADAFAGQVDAARARIKSKQECLLRFLQLAADDGAVLAGPFAPGGFFGWARFAVAPGRADEFRSGLERLFPAGFREATLQETFRRAGLVPGRWDWDGAWRGGVPFEYRQRADG